MASIFKWKFELYHALLHHVLKSYAVMDPNAHGQWARPSLHMFILNVAEHEGLYGDFYADDVTKAFKNVMWQSLQYYTYHEHHDTQHDVIVHVV